MTWFKVDDQLWGHEKWRAASKPARALWATAGSWCAANETDGIVPRHMLAVLDGKPREAAELVTIGFWHVHERGWIFHDWLDFQPSAAQVQADRAAAKERQRRARERAAESRHTSPRASRRDTTVSNGPPDPTRPDPKGLGSVGTSTRADQTDHPDDEPTLDRTELAAAVRETRAAALHAPTP